MVCCMQERQLSLSSPLCRYLLQGSGKTKFLSVPDQNSEIGTVWKQLKAKKKSVPYWPNTKEIFSDSVRYLGYSQILNLPSSDVNLLITHD